MTSVFPLAVNALGVFGDDQQDCRGIGLSGIHERLEGSGGGGNESKIIHEKKNGQSKKEGGRRE